MIIFTLVTGLMIIGYAVHGVVQDLRYPRVTPTASSPEEISIDVHVDRKVGEILMMPTSSSIAPNDYYAVIVTEFVGEGYYRVQTFHELPKSFTVHTSCLHTREEIVRFSSLT